MYNAIILVAYIPYPSRIQKYVDALLEYSKDHDIYIAINYSKHSDLFLEALNKSNIDYQYVIISQYCKETSLKEGISLYLKSNKQYHNVHFLSTNGINYSNIDFDIAFETFLKYLKKTPTINQFLKDNPLCGSYSNYGYIQHEWYLNNTNIVHPKMDWSDQYKFEYLPLRTNWHGFFTIRDYIVREFFSNVDMLKLNQFDIKMSQIVCRLGYIKHIDNFYKPFAGNKDIEKNLIKKWIDDNNLLITENDLKNYFSS